VTPPPAPEGTGRRWLPWAAAGAVLVGALVLTGRLLGTTDLLAPTPATTATTAQPRSAAPAGSVEVEGVRLAPAGTALLTSCRRAADRLGFAVPCPTLLPLPASGPAPSGVCEAGECGNKLYWFGMEGYLVPSGFTGAPGSLGALSVLASDDPRVAAGMERWCPDQRRLPATPALGGRPPVLGTCPAGFQGWATESLLLRWSRQGTYVTLGLRGASEANRRLLVRLAESLRLVPPGS
jgi:hypothetical protein